MIVEKGLVKIYCGEGKGKSTSSLGRALVCASEGKEVFMIQFLKGRHTGTLDFLKRLEPEVKVFRFEKMSKYYENLSDDEKKEENCNIRNGVNFARKVIGIGECDVLILDEFLGLVDLGIIHVDDVIQLIRNKPEEMELILTGRNLPEVLVDEADYISQIGIVKKADFEG
ncbi:MAG: cob(I)yrinic acid a,c-diamide adenosyltransferase [Clostridia bacterium]|nr:cob(I)yrinic acid a,c-diamide adenosyltransferase [Lachnospiraceae bacterium]NCB99692.1 cob(I)yrinic acid a,c-diamide adenosyltransferase [Clostridia bacterium]NCD01735.1 cob(I)yrinic acid a,c-diamide adenosyltransferase [Clostridia bacterium]